MLTENKALQDAVTGLLREAMDSPGPAMDQLVPLIYDELRAMARRQLAKRHVRHTLCTTALVHEAYLNLVDDARVSSHGRAYFFAAVANTMRQILVAHARSRMRLKRGGGLQFTSLDDKPVPVDDFLANVIDLDDALSRLDELSPRQVQIAECRIFGGLEVEDTAKALGVSPRTVKRDWAVARAWLYLTLGKGDEP